jgi:hypothetical protein
MKYWGGLRNVLYIPTVLPPSRMKPWKGVEDRGVIFGIFGQVLGVRHFLSREKHNHYFYGCIWPGGKTVGMGKTLRRLPPVPLAYERWYEHPPVGRHVAAGLFVPVAATG